MSELGQLVIGYDRSTDRLKEYHVFGTLTEVRTRLKNGHMTRSFVVTDSKSEDHVFNKYITITTDEQEYLKTFKERTESIEYVLYKYRDSQRRITIDASEYCYGFQPPVPTPEIIVERDSTRVMLTFNEETGQHIHLITELQTEELVEALQRILKLS